MTQEWATTPAQQLAFEHAIETYERQLRSAFPQALIVYGRDILDDHAPRHDAEDWEHEAFDIAVTSVINEANDAIRRSTRYETGDADA